MRNIVIIGAGNIGSRHLQAIKQIKTPLNISVIDPNLDSLNLAKQRYNSIQTDKNLHNINYYQKIEKLEKKVDLAIIATTSDVRKYVIEELLKTVNVNFLILEKILFQKEEDYFLIKDLLESNGCKAWVNCSRRLMPIYNKTLKELFFKKKIFLQVSGSNWGLMCNIMHFIDLMIYYLKSTKFIVDLSYLNYNLIPSKRKGFMELYGILQIHFENDSHGLFICYPEGGLPLTINIFSEGDQCFISEREQKAWLYNENKNLLWQEIKAEMILTSQSTTFAAQEILNENNCSLTPYEESMEIHLNLFNPILEYINKNLNTKLNYCPFT